MYVNKDELNFDIFYQGDLIKDFPFFIIDEKLDFHQLETNSEAKIEIRSKLNTVMILTQSCDVQRRTNAIVCPVYNITDFDFNKNELDAIKKRSTNYWFYLPALEGIIDEKVADFQTIYYIPRSILESYLKNKIATLSDWGRHHLSWAINKYFGRPIEDK